MKKRLVFADRNKSAVAAAKDKIFIKDH